MFLQPQTRMNWPRISSVDITVFIGCPLTFAQFRFLANLVKVFPSLRTRPLYLVGKSYAGTYIASLDQITGSGIASLNKTAFHSPTSQRHTLA